VKKANFGYGQLNFSSEEGSLEEECSVLEMVRA
jgi:hypothetical protein